MDSKSIQLAREYIKIESNAIQEASSHLNESFDKAVQLVANCSGKVVFCGLGKSGHIAHKLASTFSSLGIPSVFLHASESLHGDLGILAENDVLIFLSYSGETEELSHSLKYAVRKKLPVIGITGNLKSTLATHSTVVLSIEISKEACPYNLAPTASTTAALVLGDALGLVAAHSKGYTPEKFAEIHPSGMLGTRLTQVRERMRAPELFACLQPTDTMKTALSKMSQMKVRGIAAILDSSGKLLGSFSDGDVRRFFEKDSAELSESIKSAMNSNPKTIAPEALLEEALKLMEAHQIQSIFVADPAKKLLGLIHIQDIIKQKSL